MPGEFFKIYNVSFNLNQIGPPIPLSAIPSGVENARWTAEPSNVFPIGHTTAAQVQAIARVCERGGRTPVPGQDIVLKPGAVAMLDCEGRSDTESDFIITQYTAATKLPFACYGFRHIIPTDVSVNWLAEDNLSQIHGMQTRVEQIRKIAERIPMLMAECYHGKPGDEELWMRGWDLIAAMSRKMYPGQMLVAIARGDYAPTPPNAKVVVPPHTVYSGEVRDRFCRFLVSRFDAVFVWGERQHAMDMFKNLLAML